MASDEAALLHINVEGLFSPTGQTFDSFSMLMIPVYSWTAFLLGVLLSIFTKSTKTSRRGGGGGVFRADCKPSSLLVQSVHIQQERNGAVSDHSKQQKKKNHVQVTLS